MTTVRLLFFVLLCFGSAQLAAAQVPPSDTVFIADHAPGAGKSGRAGSVLGWVVAGLIGFGLGFGAARMTNDPKAIVAELSKENEALRAKTKELRQRVQNEKWKIKSGPEQPDPATPGNQG